MRYLIIFLIVLFSCTSTTKDSRIEKFGRSLGKDKIEVVDKAVLYLDNYVTDKYKSEDLNSNYQSFLSDILEDKIDWKEFYSNLELRNINELSQSVGLWNEIYLKFDSAYFQNGEIVTIYSYSPSDTADKIIIESSSLIMRQSDLLKIDSLIKDQETLLEYNPDGRYLKALELIKGNDSLIIHYLKQKELTGLFSHGMLAAGFIQDRADFNDKLVRQIFAIEILI